jgi:fused signal recognition particle receptor
LKIKNVFSNFKNELVKSRENLKEKIECLIKKSKNKEIFLEQLEELLIISDIGVSATEEIINCFNEINFKEYEKNDFTYFKQKLKKILTDILNHSSSNIEIKKDRLNIIMIVGVNGSGKTSAAGKMAYKFKNENNHLLLIPADTFRAAAIKQLNIMANRAGVEIIKSSEKADPASVVYDGVHAAKARKKNILIIDTAGRLHTKINLMNELKKIKKVIQKEAGNNYSLEILQTIDATMGQNGILQAKSFNESLGVSGIILTKMDGTAKGGIVIAIKRELNIPVKLISFGEQLDNLYYFENDKFINALLD